MPRKPNYKDLLKKFKKRNIKNPERIATAYVKGLTTNPALNKAPSIRIIGSVPIAIKLPKNEPMKAMLAT